MNESRKLMSSYFAFRPQLVSAACLALIVFITVLLFVNLILNGIFYSSFLPSLGLAIAVLALGVATVNHRFFNLSRKRRFVFSSIFVSVGLIVIAPFFFTRGIQQVLNYANFYFIRDAYLQKVALVKRTDVPRFIAFKWKGFEKQLLIFDESDELNFPDRVKSKEWWMRAKEIDGELTVCYWYSIKVAEHFYRVTFYCERPYSGSSIPPL